MATATQSNILDSIQQTLPPTVWDKPDSPEPVLKPQLIHFIKTRVYQILDQGGYEKAQEWARLYLTGSLCTYQYSDTSDADISLFVDATHLPEWSRAEMIGLLVAKTDGVKLPGTPYQLQTYVVAKHLRPSDLYHEGLRAAYDIDDNRWVVPPSRSLSHDPQIQEAGFYVWAMEQADKMERLLRYEPDKAVMFWHQIHKNRQRDQQLGKGDYSESNLVYKYLFKRGLVPQIAQVSGEHIAAVQGGEPWEMGQYGKGMELDDGTHVRWAIRPSFPLDQAGRPEVNEDDFNGWPTHSQYTDQWRPDLAGRSVADYHITPRGYIVNRIPMRSSSSEHIASAGWTAGSNGKGYIDTNGKAHVWNTDAMGIPFHETYADRIGQTYEDIRSPIVVAPSGHYTRAFSESSLGQEPYPTGQEPEIAFQIPGLRHVPSREVFLKQLQRGRYGVNLEGLPDRPINVPGYGSFIPTANEDLQRIAQEYNQANGLGPHPTNYTPVDPKVGQRIAQEYDRMAHNPNDPEVAAAYQALINETKAQYDALKTNGYNMEFYPSDHDPYPNSPREAVMDIANNKHLYIYPTSAGFGTDVMYQDHPLLADSGVRWNGQPVTHNDLFRGVHDMFGHAKEGVGFRHVGEDNAYRQHAAMFSPLARKALASETRGQNSWVNFGPYGENNQTADTANTVFADQKAGLMPEWTTDPDLHTLAGRISRVATWDN